MCICTMKKTFKFIFLEEEWRFEEVKNLPRLSWGLWSDLLSSGGDGACNWMCQASKAVCNHLCFLCLMSWINYFRFWKQKWIYVICFPGVQTVLKPGVVKMVHKLSDALCISIYLCWNQQMTSKWNFAGFPMETLIDNCIYWQLMLFHIRIPIVK